ncbi:DUF2690 domain-containing protein [Microbispora sp. CA-135349]|uniref:DUF2690 domain-containing protein n=1 Tax=Microbispora sp. CA-135349 TaxID=3239953 RepID=UPI003D8B6B53
MTRWSVLRAGLKALAVGTVAAAVVLAGTATGAWAGQGSGAGSGSGSPPAPSGSRGANAGPAPTGTEPGRLPHRSGTLCSLNPGRGLCDGTDPVDTGCDSDAYTVASSRLWFHDRNGRPAWRADATVELRYSRTCRTNWSRVTVGGGHRGPLTVEVCRGTGSGACTEAYVSYGTDAYSDQVYAPDVVATAYAWCCGAGPGTASARARG